MRLPAPKRNLIPLLFLFWGFTIDLVTHLSKGETLDYFLFGPQGIFAWNHFLLPLGALALTVNVALEFYSSRRTHGQDRQLR